MDHPIEHVIYEINMFAFSEIEESNKPHMWLGDLKPCYDPSKYYNDTENNSRVHEIYITTIGCDTGTVFPHKSMAGQPEPFWILVQKGVVWT